MRTSPFLRWFTEPFHYEFMQRALLGCVLVGFTNGFLSAFIVLRRLALLADALSHSLLPGLAVGAIFFGSRAAGIVQRRGGGSAAGGHRRATRRAQSSRLKDETAIGALYTVAFAVGIILLKYSARARGPDAFSLRQHPGRFQQPTCGSSTRSARSGVGRQSGQPPTAAAAGPLRAVGGGRAWACRWRGSTTCSSRSSCWR